MRNRTPLLLLALGAVGVAELNAQRAVPDQPTFVPGQVIVKMRTTVSLSANRLQALGLDSTFRQTGGAGEFLYQIPPALVGAMAATVARNRTLAVVDSLRADPNVEYAQPNYRLYAIGTRFATRNLVDIVPNDPRFAEQWHYHNNGTGTSESPGGINLPRAWETSTGSNSVSVSVLDTGILPNHPDILGSGNLVTGYDMISDPFVGNDGDDQDTDDRDPNPTDPGDALVAGECGGGWPPSDREDSWHGTHVSGTIGVGKTNNGVGIAGVNWSVSVQAVRVLGKCGGWTSDINDGIRWAAGLSVPGVPNNTSPARVINMSLGTPPGVPCSVSPSTQSAIDDAVAEGAVVVVAAGNDAVDASQVSPASCNNVITVAANDANGDLETEYSNFGSTVEIMAPGGDVTPNPAGGVLSMVKGGYAFYNGTSMAAPHVSGVAALWLAVDPSLTPAQLLTALRSAALPRTAAQCPQPCGAGLLNAVRTTETTVTMSLEDDDIGNNDRTTATATVTLGGSPQVGKTVIFDTGDPGVAVIHGPTSDVTDADGKATATVRGVARGRTDVTASTNGAVGSAPIKVPSLSTIAIVLLALAMCLVVSLRKHSALSRE